VQGSDGNAKVVGFSGSTGLSTAPHLHIDHASGYDPASSMVSGTMDPMGLVDAGLIVKGGNVKATKSTQTTSNTNNTNNTNTNTNIRTSHTRPQTSVLPSSGRYNLAQLIQLAKSVGFNDDQAIKMAAIAMAESGGDPRNDTIKSGLYKQSGETSYGLWQINMTGPYRQERFGWFGIDSVDKLYDPLTNVKAAKMVYDRQGFDAWSVYGGNRYKSYLEEAKKVSPNISSNINLNTSQTIAFAPEEEGNQNIFLVANNGAGNQSISAPIQSSTETTISYTDPSYMLNTFTKNRILLALNYV